MTTSCTSTTIGGETENSSEIPGYDVTVLEERLSAPPVDDATAPSKSKVADETGSELVGRVEETADVTARTPRSGGVGLRSAFTRSPEKTWKEAPGFQGQENYGFEFEKWARDQQRKMVAGKLNESA